MKLKLLSLLTALAILPITASAQFLSDDENTVVAVVDETVITSLDVKQKIKSQLEQLKRDTAGKDLRKQAKKLVENTLEAMINRELIYLDFKALKATLPSHLIQERIDRAISAAANGDAIRFEEALYNQGMTMKEFREQIHKDLASELLLRNKVKLGISVSNQMIKDFYEKNKFSMVKPNRYHLGAILIKPDGRNKGKVQQAVKAVQEGLKNKTPFAQLAKKYSDGPGAQQGGDLGWMESPAPVLLKAVKGLDKGESTPKPFTIGDNVYFIHVTDMTAGGVPPLDEALMQQLKKNIIQQEEQKRYREYIKELHMKYPVRRMPLGDL